MKVTPENVKTYIQQGLACEHIHVDGDGRHFEAVIVSKEFEGKGMLQQHQLVYRALGDKMADTRLVDEDAYPATMGR